MKTIIQKNNETRKDYLFRVAIAYLEVLDNDSDDSLSQLIIFDEAECDGSCLLDDMKNEINQ